MKDLLNYEVIRKKIDDKITCLFYAIMCRRWDKVCEQINQLDLSPEEILQESFLNTGITVEKCFSKNMQFLKSNKNKERYDQLCTFFGKDFDEIDTDKNSAYDSNDFEKKASVFDMFFSGYQPVLDVTYFEEQTLAARQLLNNNATMVLDEVGTGKTVAGIYAMQQSIQSRIREVDKNPHFPSAAILIICPYQKREDWNSDIRRQLGRNSIIVNQGDNGLLIKQQSVSSKKPLIYIMGCKGGEKNDSNSQLKKALKTFKEERKWDLVIIDEAHNCFDNYDGIKAERIMLLTATPIVVRTNGVRDFSTYKQKLNDILGRDQYGCKKIPDSLNITPIKIRNPKENDIFVCHYKEDIFNVKIERKIKFISCERIEKRQEWFQKLRNEKDFFTAMYADQDDNSIARKMNDHFGDGIKNYVADENKKLFKLVELVSGAGEYLEYINKSIIIFCELTVNVEMIYERLSGLASKETLVGKKYGENGEIKNITKNPDVVIERLKTHIRVGKENRSILVTTGKSSGIGLNLGEFEVIINYELPYTSNELEQRFGRIERADDLIAESANKDNTIVVENEMIFLVNAPVMGQSDFETNRMLYYSVNKASIACQHMPIRNTVLFHPEFEKRLKNDAINIFENMRKWCKSEIGKEKIKELIEYKKNEAVIKQYIVEIEKEIKINSSQTIQEEIKKSKNIQGKIKIILDEVTDAASGELIAKYKPHLVAFAKNDYTKILEFEKIIDIKIEHFILLRRTFNFWGVKLDIQCNDTSNEYYSKATDNKDPENEALPSYQEDSEKLFSDIKVIKENIIKGKLLLLEMCETIVRGLARENKMQKTIGVFYASDGKFENKLVTEFREV